jgi:hypothetical protein
MIMPVFLDPTRRQPVFGTPVEVVIDAGWPEPHHVARDRDETGRKIVEFISQWRGHPNLQESPWDPRTGTINLVPPDEPRPETDPVPLYRVKDAAAFIGCVLYTRDQVVPFPGWPAAPYALAENESASLVLEYIQKFGTDRKLSGQPHQSGRLFFWNPALVTSPISPVMRWAGGNAA